MMKRKTVPLLAVAPPPKGPMVTQPSKVPAQREGGGSAMGGMRRRTVATSVRAKR